MSDQQTKLPFTYNTYRIWVSETVGGYISVNAEDQDQARDTVDDLLQEYGVEAILYPDYYGRDQRDKERLQEDITTAKVVGSKHTQGDREIIECEEIDRYEQ